MSSPQVRRSFQPKNDGIDRGSIREALQTCFFSPRDDNLFLWMIASKAGTKENTGATKSVP